MSYSIRKYKHTDREALRDICHKTATAPQFVNNKDLVASLYCEYYTDYEPDNIFVVQRDSDGVAVGYILCAENYKNYIKTFKKYQLEKVKKIDKKYAIIHQFEFILDRLNGKKYPAHMHIDILPEAQRQGFGTKLCDQLINHLKEKGVKGLCLGVGSDNEMGISFYKKYGFTLYRDGKKFGKVFGLDLTDK